MKTTAYIRVSTDKQDEASQREIINSWCIQHCREISDFATDQASGALPWQERALSFVLDKCNKGDCIVVSEISRIARSTVGVLTFLQAVAEKGGSVVAIKSGIVLDGSTASKIVVCVLAMAAEIERDLMRERTKAALAARKQKGLAVGRQHGAAGKKNKLSGRTETIEGLLSKGVSISSVAKILEVSRGTLYKFINQSKTQVEGNINVTSK